MFSLLRSIRDRFAGRLVLASTRLDRIYEDRFFDRMVDHGPDNVEFDLIDRTLSRWANRLERWGLHMMGELTVGELMAERLEDLDAPVAFPMVDQLDGVLDELLEYEDLTDAEWPINSPADQTIDDLFEDVEFVRSAIEVLGSINHLVVIIHPEIFSHDVVEALMPDPVVTAAANHVWIEEDRMDQVEDRVHVDIDALRWEDDGGATWLY